MGILRILSKKQIRGKLMSAIPSGPRPKHLTIGRIGMYCFILVCAIFFLMPLYVMVITSLKDMDEIRAASGAKLETAIATVMSSDSFTKT